MEDSLGATVGDKDPEGETVVSVGGGLVVSLVDGLKVGSSSSEGAVVGRGVE